MVIIVAAVSVNSAHMAQILTCRWLQFCDEFITTHFYLLILASLGAGRQEADAWNGAPTWPVDAPWLDALHTPIVSSHATIMVERRTKK